MMRFILPILKLGLGSGVDVWPLPEDASDQPRTTSTHANILGKWVREQGALTLMQAIANSSYVPAKALDEPMRAAGAAVVKGTRQRYAQAQAWQRSRNSE